MKCVNDGKILFWYGMMGAEYCSSTTISSSILCRPESKCTVSQNKMMLHSGSVYIRNVFQTANHQRSRVHTLIQVMYRDYSK